MDGCIEPVSLPRSLRSLELRFLASWSYINADGRRASTALFTLVMTVIGMFRSTLVSLFPGILAHSFRSDGLASKTGVVNTAIRVGVLPGPSAVYAVVESDVSRSWRIGY